MLGLYFAVPILTRSTLVPHGLSCLCAVHPVKRYTISRALGATQTLATVVGDVKKMPATAPSAYAVLRRGARRGYGPFGCAALASCAHSPVGSQSRELACRTVGALSVIGAGARCHDALTGAAYGAWYTVQLLLCRAVPATIESW